MLKLASSRPAGPEFSDDPRRALLAKIHVASKALAMHDDDYRALLERHTGERSAGRCTIAQLEYLVCEFERLGFRPSGRPARAGRKRADHAVAGKARALWISLHQLGAIDNPAELALEMFAKRQLCVDRLQWADQAQGYRLIEALKAMAERHGWSQAVPSALRGLDRIRWLKERLLDAQLAKLSDAERESLAALAADRSAWTIENLETASGALASLLQARQRAGT
jgi:phage gp16-like protein